MMSAQTRRIIVIVTLVALILGPVVAALFS
ncbi:Uncharacterised protein [Kytococcus sedentarius]|nr:Uncharacterised protein [Kytococcus sedentarius]